MKDFEDSGDSENFESRLEIMKILNKDTEILKIPKILKTEDFEDIKIPKVSELPEIAKVPNIFRE